MGLKLKENVVITRNDFLTIIHYGITKYEFEDQKGEIYKQLINFKKNSDSQISDDLLEYLVSEYLVVKNWEISREHETSRFERYLFYLEDILCDVEITPITLMHNVIKKKKILILGLGGIGTVVLKNLLNSGFTNFILIDGDVVEMSNLNRQLFYHRRDIGKRKVDILEEHINNEYDDVNIKKIPKYVTNRNEISEILESFSPNMIINCADSPKNIDELVYSVTKGTDIYCYSGNVGIQTGTYGSMSYKTGMFNDNQAILGSSSSSNMIIGAILSEMVIQKMLKAYIATTDIIDEKMVFNFQNFINERLK